MALILKDRVLELSYSEGTGSFTLGGAYNAFQTFAASVGVGNTTYYTIVDENDNQWEVGIGTLSDASTLTRDTVLASSSSGAKVNFGGGGKNVFCDYPATKSVYLDASDVVTVPSLTATTIVKTPIVQAVNSGGLALKNSAGTTQISMGGGGGDNVSVNVSTNLNGTNAQIDISPTGTGHVHIKPTGVNSVEIAPTFVGEIDNMTIGGTTRAAGSFTTLSTTGVATFSAGTALLPAITTTGDTNTGIYFPATDTIAFTEGGVEAMRINSSGNVGIGTASPSSRLHIYGADSVLRVESSTSSNGYVQYINTAGSMSFGMSGAAINAVLLYDRTNSQTAYTYVGGASGLHAWNTQNTERMRIDSSGNVGIGTSSPAVKFQVNSSGAVISNFIGNNANNYIQISDNNGTNLVSVGSIAGGNFYAFSAGYNAFYAGSTERMRIGSSGNVGIGTSSPTTKLTVSSATNAGINVTDGTVNTIIYNSTGGVSSFGTTTNHSLQIYTNNTAKVTIDTSGNVGIGTSSPNSAPLTLAQGTKTYGVFLQANSSSESGNIRFVNSGVTAEQALIGTINGGGLYFNTGSSSAERMRIDSSGNVLIGKTSATANGGDLQVSSGITFPATQVAKSDANTLDDYEEGTWTPTDGSPAGLSFTNTSGNCFYTKIGNLVTCTFALTYPITADAVNAAIITGLPFTAKSTTNSVAAGVVSFTNSSLTLTILVGGGDIKFNFYGTNGITIKNSQLSTFTVRGSVTYLV